MLGFVTENELIPQHLSSFRSEDFCINQLPFNMQGICKSFDNVLDVRSVFLGISKSLDKLWLDGIIIKLKKYHN